MKTFTIRFEAVELGALGKSSMYIRDIQAAGEADAVIQLYNHFEHISVKTVWYDGIEGDKVFEFNDNYRLHVMSNGFWLENAETNKPTSPMNAGIFSDSEEWVRMIALAKLMGAKIDGTILK